MGLSLDRHMTLLPVYIRLWLGCSDRRMKTKVWVF